MRTRMSVRQAVIECLRRRGIRIGEDATIASGEWGYWVGSHYITNSEISRVLSEDAL